MWRSGTSAATPGVGTVGAVPYFTPRMGLVAAAAALATAVSVTLVSGCDDAGGTSAQQPVTNSMVTSTTRIAGAGVLGNERRPDDSCAPDPAPLDEGPDPREVRHAAGSTEVRADPQRIVVLSGDQLDALCALGLQSRIVAAALPDGSTSQPSYLGTVVHDVPAGGLAHRSRPERHPSRIPGPDPRFAGPHRAGLRPAVGDRTDGVHRSARRGVAGHAAHGR